MNTRLLAYLAAAAAAALITPTLAEDQPTVVNIVNGPKFDQPNVTITAGQSIKWIPVKPNVPHHLFRGEPPTDGSEPPKENAITEQFMKPTEPVKKFDKVETTKYFCAIHPTTMV